MYSSVNEFMDIVTKKNAGEVEFHQAVLEVVESLWDYLQENPHYLQAKILDRIVEPERVLMFRVPWRDDRGEIFWVLSRSSRTVSPRSPWVVEKEVQISILKGSQTTK